MKVDVEFALKEDTRKICVNFLVPEKQHHQVLVSTDLSLEVAKEWRDALDALICKAEGKEHLRKNLLRSIFGQGL